MVVHQGLAWALNSRINREAQTVRPPKQSPFQTLAFVLPFHIPWELACGVELRAAVRVQYDLTCGTLFVWDFENSTAPPNTSPPGKRAQLAVGRFRAYWARRVEWDRSQAGGTSRG